eukprot:CCRYP_012146-RA/>CCRYP_012146-RA protein AED:0.42 eAED:0.74 QI:0/0/0/1/1/1/3/0/259
MPWRRTKDHLFQADSPQHGKRVEGGSMGVRDSSSFYCMRSAIHACKQMGLDTDLAAAEKAVETAKIEAELAKQDYVTMRNAEKEEKGNKQERPPFELYGNLLSDEARQPWEKIIKAQVTKAPWEDIREYRTGDSHEDLELVSRLNSYLETLPCLYYSPKANQATKKVLPLDDADLATHLLRMCPAKWQTQYDLTENTTPVSTRALLLVLENIENNAELDNKPANTTKAKGADTKRKMESMDSRIPKKPKKVGWTALCAM